MRTLLRGLPTDANNISSRKSIRNIHDLGASWLKAIRSVIDIKGRVACALIDFSRALCDAGEGILMTQLKDAHREARRLELERDEAASENLGRGSPTKRSSPSRSTYINSRARRGNVGMTSLTRRSSSPGRAKAAKFLPWSSSWSRSSKRKSNCHG